MRTVKRCGSRSALTCDQGGASTPSRRRARAATAARRRSRCDRCAGNRGRCARRAGFFGHVDRGSVRGCPAAICAQTTCAKFFASGQSTALFLASASGVTTCRPLPPVVLQKDSGRAPPAAGASPSPPRSTAAKSTSGAGIEVEHQAAGNLGLAPVRNSRDAARAPAICATAARRLDAVDLQIGLAVARDFHQLEQIGRARHGVALKELLPADAVGRADDRTGPPADMRRSSTARPPRNSAPGRAWSPGVSSPGVGPQRLVGVGDRHAHHDGLAAGGLRRCVAGLLAGLARGAARRCAALVARRRRRAPRPPPRRRACLRADP